MSETPVPDAAWERAVRAEARREYERTRQEAALRAELDTARARLASAVAPIKRLRELLTLHSRDWALDRRDALLWALLVGWECEGGCEESDDPEHACDGAMRELAERHQWPPQFIDGVRKHRATIRELSHAELRPLPVKDTS